MAGRTSVTYTYWSIHRIWVQPQQGYKLFCAQGYSSHKAQTTIPHYSACATSIKGHHPLGGRVLGNADLVHRLDLECSAYGIDWSLQMQTATHGPIQGRPTERILGGGKSSTDVIRTTPAIVSIFHTRQSPGSRLKGLSFYWVTFLARSLGQHNWPLLSIERQGSDLKEALLHVVAGEDHKR